MGTDLILCEGMGIFDEIAILSTYGNAQSKLSARKGWDAMHALRNLANSDVYRKNRTRISQKEKQLLFFVQAWTEKVIQELSEISPEVSMVELHSQLKTFLSYELLEAPEKYWRIERHYLNFMQGMVFVPHESYYIEFYTLKVQALSFLAQKLQNNLVLTAIMNAASRREDLDFDSYISSWAKRLLSESIQYGGKDHGNKETERH